jgi:hypothetical protein
MVCEAPAFVESSSFFLSPLVCVGEQFAESAKDDAQLRTCGLASLTRQVLDT